MTKVDLKIILLGRENVGKSCLVDRFLNSTFEELKKNTIGAAFGAKRIFLPSGHGITLGIWDTAGAERFESLSRVYYHSAGAAMVCFDPMCRASWERVSFWVQELRDNQPDCKIYLVHTKLDVTNASREVSEAEVDEYSRQICSPVHQTSAKHGYNVNELFLRVAEDAAQEIIQSGPATSSPSVQLESSNSSQGLRCCHS